VSAIKTKKAKGQEGQKVACHVAKKVTEKKQNKTNPAHSFMACDLGHQPRALHVHCTMRI